MSTTAKINEAFVSRITQGLTSKCRTTLGAIQGTNNQIYFTGADVAFEMIKRFHSGMEVNQPTFAAISQQCSTMLRQMETKGDNVFRTNERIACRIANNHYAVKASFGYRIGVPISPLVNKDMVEEKRVYEQAAKEVASNPLEAILPVLPMLTMAQLTKLALEVLAAKDDLFLKLQEAQFNAAMENPRNKELTHEQ